METGPRLKVSSDRLVKPGIEPATPGLQGKRFIHYTTAAPLCSQVRLFADDKALYLKLESEDDSSILQNDLNILSAWETR